MRDRDGSVDKDVSPGFSSAAGRSPNALLCWAFLSMWLLYPCLVISPSGCPNPIGPLYLLTVASLFAFGALLRPDLKPFPTAASMPYLAWFLLLFLLTTLLRHPGESKGGIHGKEGRKEAGGGSRGGIHGNEGRKQAGGPRPSLKHILTSSHSYLPRADLHGVSQCCNQCGLGGMRDIVNCELVDPVLIECCTVLALERCKT